MYSYRVTKYNPIYRNERGAFLNDDWTSVSDIGKSFVAGALSPEEYINIETAYTNAILAFMKCNNLNSLVITNLSKTMRPIKSSICSQEMIDMYRTLKDNQAIDLKDIPAVARLILREHIWGRLLNEKMFVHFGYDYYMYIGSQKTCPITVFQIEQSGLFVEEFASPYLELPEEEDDQTK